jgi:hypothetical protein
MIQLTEYQVGYIEKSVGKRKGRLPVTNIGCTIEKDEGMCRNSAQDVKTARSWAEKA